MHTFTSKILLIAAIALFSGTASAAIFQYEAHVLRILNTDGQFGGCAAELDRPPSLLAADCTVALVTFDCSGFAGTPSRVSSAALSAAQLALVTGNKVRVTINNCKKDNGTCYAQRIDNYASPGNLAALPGSAAPCS